LYEKPENAFVAQFIGENNQMLGTVQSVSKIIATVKAGLGRYRKGACGEYWCGWQPDDMLSVRPERCIVSTKKSAAVSTLDARIEELIYLGDHIRCRMNVAGDDQFIVKVPNTSGQLGSGNWSIVVGLAGRTMIAARLIIGNSLTM
jgi:putative spermidine/putrescine transport system ATP-binding protein